MEQYNNSNTEYEEHLTEMISLNNIEDYTDQQVNDILYRLLKALPNSGKLYKYKTIDNSKSFDEIYDSLEKGYIYLADPSSMNDDLDGTLFYDEESLCEASKYLRDHPHTVIKWALTRENSSIYDLSIAHSLDNEHIKKLFNFYEDNNAKINEFKSVDYLTKQTSMSVLEAAYVVKDVNYAISELYDTFEKASSTVIKNFEQINDSAYRDMNKIYCLCSSFANNSMWAKYANNKGVCIEYDYNLIKSKSIDIKRLMISIYKVIYNNEKPKHSFLLDLKYMFKDNISEEEIINHNKDSVLSLITKETSWQNEDEWRIVLSVDYHKLYCDFVSKIYITDNIVKTDYYVKLRELAYKHGWPIIVRKTNKNKTGYIYIQE